MKLVYFVIDFLSLTVWYIAHYVKLDVPESRNIQLSMELWAAAKKSFKPSILLNITFHAPMGIFQLELIYFYYLLFHRRPIQCCVFLSCRPFVVNVTFSTSVEVSLSPGLGSWQLEFKSLIISIVGYLDELETWLRDWRTAINVSNRAAVLFTDVLYYKPIPIIYRASLLDSSLELLSWRMLKFHTLLIFA